MKLAENVDVRVYMSPSAVDAALDWERAHLDSATRRFALGHTTAGALQRAELDACAPHCDDGPITEELVRELAKHPSIQAGLR